MIGYAVGCAACVVGAGMLLRPSRALPQSERLARRYRRSVKQSRVFVGRISAELARDPGLNVAGAYDPGWVDVAIKRARLAGVNARDGHALTVWVLEDIYPVTADGQRRIRWRRSDWERSDALFSAYARVREHVEETIR